MGVQGAEAEMSAVEAALRLGVSRERVIRLVQIGKLTGRRDTALGWRVSREAVEAATVTVAA